MNEIITTQLPALIEATSKKDIELLADNIITDLLIYGVTPLQLAEKISATEYLVKALKADKRYVDCVLEELAKYKGKYSNNGSKIEACEVGTKYSYDNCNDPVLKSLELDLERISQDIKERQEFLKAVPASGLIVTDIDTAEVFTCYPPTKTSTSSYKVTLAR